MPDYDMAVVRQAFLTAVQLGASAKVQQALFEAGIVESGFHNNTKATDHDSLGYLQQRPSQGWPNPTDVPTATKSFVERAKASEAKYATPGQLAQAVQRSAHPERYDKVAPEATALLNRIRLGTGLQAGLDALKPPNPLDALPNPGDLVGAVQNAARALHDIAGGVTTAGRVADGLLKLMLPSNLLRLVMGVLGIVFVFIGIAQLGREVRR